MTDKPSFDDMPLTKVLQEWLNDEGWQDHIETDDSRVRAEISTNFSVNDQPHRLFFNVDEEREWLSVYMYSPMNVPHARMGEVTRILNRVNTRLGLGRLACYDDEESNPLQFLVRIDVEGSALTTRQITSMISAAIGTFRGYGQLLIAAALTKQSVDSLWNEFLEEESADQKVREEAGPSEL